MAEVTDLTAMLDELDVALTTVSWMPDDWWLWSGSSGIAVGHVRAAVRLARAAGKMREALEPFVRWYLTHPEDVEQLRRHAEEDPPGACHAAYRASEMLDALAALKEFGDDQ